MHQLETLPGHPQIKACLKKLLPASPSTLLFEGPKGVGKAAFAKAFAHALLSDASPHKLESGNHPDFRELYPEGKALMHPMQAMKTLINESQMPPFESSRKVFIIYEADRMLPSSSNALLKTLEEPPPYAHFILVSSHPELLLTTIVSRALQVTFFPLTTDEMSNYLESSFKKTPAEAKQIAWLSHGSLAKAEKLAKEKDDQLLSVIAEMGTAALHQSYPHLFRSFAKLDSLIEKSQTDAIEEVLAAVYYWYRDLHLLKAGGDHSLLFFQGQEEQLKKNLNCPLPELEELQRRMKRIEEALLCHISLRHCLTHLML